MSFEPGSYRKQAIAAVIANFVYLDGIDEIEEELQRTMGALPWGVFTDEHGEPPADWTGPVLKGT